MDIESKVVDLSNAISANAESQESTVVGYFHPKMLMRSLADLCEFLSDMDDRPITKAEYDEYIAGLFNILEDPELAPQVAMLEEYIGRTIPEALGITIGTV